ncbi:hypothetical protein EJ05DRAFT_474015 [Pseudovirgaria hyperparasitica]|uniref:Uncharacterized protein n=1 Tax=Pseudovirgaria hyperparasitica TaxID=470096 RepID=A0A6A6WE20_9PEZI|nr:uncharacterized protein EJ05DRAFT_474015 [Pseudovirgaria hyperparasitica]KAF2760106.1 hypothetical protein EJ05DRAFT_474015 [Pseudovirgaria hyperparasitica]
MPAGPGLTQDSTHPSPSALRQQRLNAFQPHQATPTISSQPDQGEISDADSETLEMPPYATVDNLALEHLIGEQREQAERAERNKVERLRLEGALARQDAGDFSDPVPKQD